MVYDSFAQWVEGVAMPLRQANPTWHRLDGRDVDGNREVVGRFRYEGRVWKVHGDTRFDPVMRAYRATRDGKMSDPFVVEQAQISLCLNLKSELGNTQLPNHVYVYAQAEWRPLLR